MVALNSNCNEIGGCEAGSPQEQWLRADLAAHPHKCTLAYMHHPRFSSGKHGNTDAVDALWKALAEAKVDVVLAGHDHNYERFHPQSATGAPYRYGLRLIVVGTGGASLRPFEALQPGELRAGLDRLRRPPHEPAHQRLRLALPARVRSHVHRVQQRPLRPALQVPPPANPALSTQHRAALPAWGGRHDDVCRAAELVCVLGCAARPGCSVAAVPAARLGCSAGQVSVGCCRSETSMVSMISRGEAKWHAERCSLAPSGREMNAGSSTEHFSCALKHRVWNRQPDGGLAGEGTSP